MITKDQIQEFYNSRSQHQKRSELDPILALPYEHVYNYLQNSLAPNSKVLDFACGDGIHSEVFGALGFLVTGIDLSSVSISSANENRNKNCEFLQGDEFHHSLSPSSFDCIFVSGAMYYFSEPTIDRLVELLVPGGVFVCIETNGDNTALSFLRTFKTLFLRNRDEQTLNNLWGRHEIQKFISKFEDTTVIPMQAFQLFLTIWPFTFLRAVLMKLLINLDNFSLTLAPSLAFKNVIIVKKPSIGFD